MNCKFLFGVLPVALFIGCVATPESSSKRASLFGSALPSQATNVPKEDNSNPFNLPLTMPKGDPNLASKNNADNSMMSADAYLYRQQLMRSRELQKVENNVWRTSSHPSGVFSILVKLLSQNYILRNIDRRNFSLTTDWDKFFVEGRLFRNRINVTVFPLSNKQTEVIVRNFVEYYSGNPQNTEESVSSWLPSPDITDEVTRIVDSMNKQIAARESRANRLR